MSAYKILYNDIHDTLSGSTTLKTVEDFNNQYQNQEINNNLKYPACYIQASNVYWDKNNINCYSLAQPPQNGRATIQLHIVNHTLKPHKKEAKNELFDLVDHVTSLVHRMMSIENVGGNYTTLMRTQEQYISPNKQLNVAIITFETQLNDLFPVPEYEVTTGVTFTLSTDYN